MPCVARLPQPPYRRGVTHLVSLRGARGVFFLSHHPWIAVVLIAVVVGLVYYQNQRKG